MVTLPPWASVSSPSLFSAACYHVRSAEIRDLSQLSDVLTNSFYPPSGWRRWCYPLLRLGIYEDLKQRLQNTQRHYRCLTAIATHPAHQEVLVGTVEMSCRRYSLWTFNQPPQIYLSNLAVREDCRRRGVARRLLEAAEKQALTWGFRAIYLHVMADNMQARLLYQQAGYRVQRVDTTPWALILPQPQRLLLKKVISPQAS